MNYRKRYIRLGFLVVIVFLLLALPWAYLKYELEKTKGKEPVNTHLDNPIRSIPREQAQKDIENLLNERFPQKPGQMARLLPRHIHAYEYLRQIQLNREDHRIISDLLETLYPDFYSIQLKYQDRIKKTR